MTLSRRHAKPQDRLATRSKWKTLKMHDGPAKHCSQELKDKGNQEFGHGRFEEAEKIYTDALDIAPLCFTELHAVLLSNRAAAKTKQEKWQEVVADCDKAIAIGSPNEKPLERRANAYAHIEEELEKAIEDYRKLLELKPGHKPYLTAIQRIEKEIEERNERTKDKVMEQLKELGNMCLRPFGLSTDNFAMVPNPGGGYSIQMKK
ncbi:TPR Domain containing protein [Aphelenchoides avenae]|nr:TPR Domain containing protein [Aphelenchus avenae]